MEKILLIQPSDPPNTRIVRDHMGQFGIMDKNKLNTCADVYPPLLLAYTASLLEKNDFKVNLIDSPTLNLSEAEVMKNIEKEQPELVIINVAGVSMKNDLRFANDIKNHVDAHIGVVGPHISLIPEVIKNYENVEFIVKNEIEYSTLEVAKNFPKLSEIKGIIYKQNGKIIENPAREFIKNLDELPFPAYHLLPMKKYSHLLFKRKYFTTVLSSRGCPFGCNYCPYPLGFGDVWRGRSPENVIEELKLLQEKYKIKSVLFRDQIFTFNMERAENICDQIVKEGIDIDWRCEARIDRLSKELMIKMKKAGCQGIHVGIESGDPQILEKSAKVGLTLEMVEQRFKEANEIDLQLLGFFIIGLPEQTKQSVMKTFDMIRRMKVKRLWFTPIVPYPGTELYNIATKKGWLSSEDWSKFTGRDVIMRTDNLTMDDIQELVSIGNGMFSSPSKDLLSTTLTKRGFKIVISNPKKVMWFIGNKIRSW